MRLSAPKFDSAVRILVCFALIFSIVSNSVSLPIAQARPANEPPSATATPFASPISTLQPTPTTTPQSVPVTSSTTDGMTSLAVSVSLTPTQAIIGATGGRLQAADGRLQLDVPSGLLKASTRLNITPRRAQATRDGSGPRVQFDLDAFDTLSNTAVITFDQPLTLTVDVRDLIDRSTLKDTEHLVVLRKTNNPDSPWAELIDTVEITPGVLRVPLQHFSTYALDSTGNESNGWQLRYNPPVVSLFSGAAIFNYPIETPIGQGGLTPNVSLAYSTRSLDGLVGLNQDDTDGLPPGWSLDVASIARVGTKLDKYKGAIFIDQFALTLNGTGHDLEPGVNTQTFGQFYAVDAPGLYVERRNDSGWNGSPLNASHEYWIVRTGEGTTYRLGYNSDSEQTIDGGECAGYCGLKTATRWRVDEITDVYSNRIALSYFSHSTSSGMTSEHTRLSAIDYNFINSGGITATSRIEFVNSGGAYNWIDQIRVYNAGITNKIREYHLGLAYDTSANMHTQITSLTQYNGAVTQSLPSTTFTYEAMQHAPEVYLEDSYVPRIPYVTRIDNGYGGATEFSYLSDNRSEWKDKDKEGGWKIWDFGYSYVVTETRTYDRPSATPARVQYAYGTRCYDQTGGEHSNPFTPCTGRNPDEFGPLVGHDLVTVTTLAFDDSMVSRETHALSIASGNSPLRGRENSTKTFDPIDLVHPLTQITNTYAYVTAPITFTYLQKAETTSFASGLAANQQVTYTYDNYGNTTETVELGDLGAAADDRKTASGFYPLTTITNIPKATFWTPDWAEAQTTASGSSPDYARDGNIGSSWHSNSFPNGPYHPQWINMRYNTARAIDIVKFIPHDDPPVSCTLLYRDLATEEWLPIASQPYSDGSTEITLRLASAITTTGIQISATILSGNTTDGFEFAVREMWAGKTPETNTGQWIVSKPGYTNVYSRATAAASWTLVKSTWYGYDNHPQFDAIPTKGELTAVRAWNGAIPAQLIDTVYTYDTFGNRRTETTFDGVGDGTHYASTNPRTTTTDYDTTYNLYPVKVTNAKGFSTTIGYSYAFGMPLTTTDVNGAATTYTYDTFGRVLDIYRPGDAAGDPSTRYHYFDTGDPIFLSPFQIDETHKPASLNLGARHFYDGLGREIQTHQPTRATVSGYATAQDIVMSRFYDARGLVVSETTPYAVNAYYWNGNSPYTTTNLTTAPKTLTAYDTLGRVTLITAPDGTTIEHRYNLANVANQILAVENVVDANRHRKQYRTDVLGRLVSVSELDGNCTDSSYFPGYPCVGNYTASWTSYATTTYTYDILNNLRAVTDALGNTTVIGYDVLGRKTGMTDPDMGNWRYEYDLAGNLVLQIDAKRQATHFYYDELNRLKGKTYNPGPIDLNTHYVRPPDPGYGQYAVNFYYDQPGHGAGLGRRTTMTNTADTTTWTYDERGRLTDESKTINGAGTFNTGYAYDALDRVTAITYPTGEVVTQTYNSQGALENVRQSNGEWYVKNLDYNANGALALQQLGNNVDTAYQYFPLSFRLQQIQISGMSLGGSQSFTYGYDNVGNITNLTAAWTTPSADTVAQQFKYDALDRLTHAISVTNGYTGTYTYNSIGNLTTKNETGTPITYTYQATQPHAVRSLTNGGLYDYDLNGNMTTRVEVSGTSHITYTQTWDIENRLKSVMNTSTYSVTRFAYDGDGTRILQIKPDGSQMAYVGGVYEVETTPAMPTPMYGFNGQVVRQEDARGMSEVTITLLRDEVCDPNGTLQPYLQWSPPITLATWAGATLFLYDAAGGALGSYPITLVDDGLGQWSGGANIDLAAGSYQGYVRAVAKGYQSNVTWYSAVQSFAVNAGATTSIRLDPINATVPTVGPVTPLPYTVGETTTTALISTTTNAAGLYALNPGDIPYTPGCNGSLRLVETVPPSNTAVLAQSVAPGSVINATEIRYPALSTSDYPDNNFVVSGPLAPPSTPSDELFADGFESGSFVAWSAASTNNGNLSVAPAAALNGSYGLQAQIVDNTGLYVRDDTPEAEPRYRARFTFDPNSINIGYGGMHDIFVGRSGTIDVFRVQVTRLYGSYQLRTQARFDSATYTTTAWVAISDAAHLIELDWQAATSVGANNGYLAWWLDGVSQSPLANLDNDTRRVNEVRLGPSNGIDTYTRGTEYFDDFESRRSTYIGPVAPSLASSEIHKSYYHAGATLVAVRVQGDPTAANNGLFYLHSDHLGSTSLTTCGTATTEGRCGGVEFGGVVSRQLYDAWGNVRVRGNLPTDIGYTGQRENTDSQLVQMGARWYDPAIGRWLSPDTIVPDPNNPQSLNRYSYVNNDPLKFIDPSGHFTCDGADNCHEIIEQWLKILEASGQLGKDLVDFFRMRDTAIQTYCSGFGLCASFEIKDQIHIVTDPNLGAYMQANASDGHLISASQDMWKEVLAGADPNYMAGFFAHEVEHLRQGFFLAGSVDAEAKAWAFQYQIWQDLGYDARANSASNIYARAAVAGYDLVNSPDYNQQLPNSFIRQQYPDMPLYRFDAIGDRLKPFLKPLMDALEYKINLYKQCPLCLTFQ